MNFALTEDQAMIRDAAQEFLAEQSGSAAVRAAMESETGFDAGVWQSISRELGWCGIPVPEAYGGLGLGPVELVLVLEQMGRYLLCAPYFSTVCLAANVLNHVAEEDERHTFLGGIADGDLRATVPLPSNSGDWCGQVSAHSYGGPGGPWELNGQCALVPDGASAEQLLVFARIEGQAQPALFALPRDTDGLRITALPHWDATRPFARVELHQVRPHGCLRIDDPARMADGLVRSTALARLAIAAEQLGGAQQCLDLTVAYTATRKQFGRAIASFQAVKHRCAEMMVRIEAARSAVYGAAAFAAGEAGPDAVAIECAAARVLASDTSFYCAQEAIQLHGGVGFTWEYDPQLYFKRAQASSHWLGNADALREQIAQALIA